MYFTKKMDIKKWVDSRKCYNKKYKGLNRQEVEVIGCSQSNLVIYRKMYGMEIL